MLQIVPFRTPTVNFEKTDFQREGGHAVEAWDELKRAASYVPFPPSFGPPALTAASQ